MNYTIRLANQENPYADEPIFEVRLKKRWWQPSKTVAAYQCPDQAREKAADLNQMASLLTSIPEVPPS